jgi:hypothetical protein
MIEDDFDIIDPRCQNNGMPDDVVAEYHRR